MSDTPETDIVSIDFNTRDELLAALCYKIFGAKPLFKEDYTVPHPCDANRGNEKNRKETDTKQMGAVTISRNGYIEDLERQLAEAKTEVTRACLREQAAIDDYKAQKERADDALLALTEARKGWQPISTAPKDGTEILVGFDCASVWVVHVAWWRCWEDWMDDDPSWSVEDIGWWSYTKSSVSQEKLEGGRTPTHWMPLPEPPDALESV